MPKDGSVLRNGACEGGSYAHHEISIKNYQDKINPKEAEGHYNEKSVLGKDKAYNSDH